MIVIKPNVEPDIFTEKFVSKQESVRDEKISKPEKKVQGDQISIRSSYDPLRKGLNDMKEGDIKTLKKSVNGPES